MRWPWYGDRGLNYSDAQWHVSEHIRLNCDMAQGEMLAINTLLRTSARVYEHHHGFAPEKWKNLVIEFLKSDQRAVTLWQTPLESIAQLIAVHRLVPPNREVASP